MALETDNPPPAKKPKEPQPKDINPPFVEHDTTGGESYGTTEGVKESDEQFEQVLVPKKQASNVAEPKPGDVDTSDKDKVDKDKAHPKGKK
jgi:hypothetical protein